MNLLTVINNELAVFETVAFKLSNVIAYSKVVLPATHTTPEMYVLTVALEGVTEAVMFKLESEEELDKAYAKFTEIVGGLY